MEKFTYYTPKVETSGRKSPQTPPGSPPPETPPGSPPGDKTPARLSECGSPEPNCAICLGKLQNKSFTDSCLHTFCFNCLLEWSKVKPECPLCKQSFKSIIHNVRSMDEYEEYHLRPTPSEAVCPFSRTFRYRTTITFGNGFGRANEDRHMQDGIIPPLRLPAINRRRHPQYLGIGFRRHIYEDNLWANPLPDVTGRFRESNPDFYRNNPGQVPRLVGWLNRELTALLNNPPHVLIIVDHILATLNVHEIRSVGFRTEMQPYIGERTDHFVHEFFVYATTPYDMMGYDEMVVYFPRTNYLVAEIPDSSSSSDSDIIVLDDERESTTNMRTERIRDIYNSSPEPGPSRHHDEWPEPSRHRAEQPGSSRRREERPGSSRLREERPGPSRHQEERPEPSRRREERLESSRRREERSETSRQRERTLENASNSRAQANTASDSDNDIVVVGVVKPRHERTPEIIDLSSDEEPEVIAERPTRENQEEESVWFDDEPSYSFRKWKLSHSSSSDNSTLSSLSESETSDDDYNPASENSRRRPRRRTLKTRTTRFKVTKSKAAASKSLKSRTEEKKRTLKKKHKKSRSRSSTRSLSSLSLSSVSSISSSSLSSSRWSNTATNGSEVKTTWRIKKCDRDGESSSDDFQPSDTIHIRPPYTARELETSFGQDRRPRLRSIIIARSNPGPSTSYSFDNEPTTSSRRNHSRSTSKHKKQKHCERRKKKKSSSSHKKRQKNSSSSSSSSSSSDFKPSTRIRKRKKSKKYVSSDSST